MRTKHIQLTKYLIGHIIFLTLVMPPPLEKLKEHIALGLSVRPFFRLSICPSNRLSVRTNFKIGF